MSTTFLLIFFLQSQYVQRRQHLWQFHQSNAHTANTSAVVPALCDSPLTLPHVSALHAAQCHKRYPFADAHNLTVNFPIPSCFIAVTLHDNDDIIMDVINELIRLIHALCNKPLCDNVFVSVYESNSQDHTAAPIALLRELMRAWRLPHHIQSGGSDDSCETRAH